LAIPVVREVMVKALLWEYSQILPR